MLKKLNKFHKRIVSTQIKEVLESGFEYAGGNYHMGDLTVFANGDEYYYFSPSGSKTLIKSLKTLSGLVYGDIQYLKGMN